MLKYGEIQFVQPGYSKNVTPRNLTYRTANTAISLAAQTTSALLSLTGGGTGGGGGTTDNITATTADFVNLNANSLNTDIIKKKTSTNFQILVNDNLGVSDVTNGKATFNFRFNKDAILSSNSINFDSPIISFRDNVISLNSQAKTSLNYTFQENLLFSNALSGFVFPNINEKDGNLIGTNQIANNSLLILPANHFLNYNLNQKKIGFTKYSGNYHFGNDELGNNVRFVKTNYGFDKDSTLNKTPLNFGLDSTLNTINSLNNLLNLEAKNIALGNGDIVLLNGVSFNPTDISNTPQGKSFNFKFNDIDSSNNLSVFKIEKEKAAFNIPEVELNNNISFNNYDTANPKLLYKTSDDFIISRKNDDINLPDLDYMKFHKNTDGTGKITFLQPLSIQGGSQGVSLVGPVLDFSGNGEAYFGDNLNFNSNNLPIVTFNKDFINIQPELRFTGTSTHQNIKFYPNELMVIDISDNKFLSFNSSSNFVKVHKILDLSSNGAIQFGSSINFRSRNSTPFTIRSNSVDISCNTLNFRQLSASFVRFNGNFTFADNGTNINTNRYIGFDSTSKTITMFKPINFINDGDINFQNSISFNTYAGKKLFTIYQDISLNSYWDTSANLQFLNRKSVIKFPDNGTLDFQDVFGFSYFTMNSVKQTIDFENPLRLTGTGEIVVDRSLNIVNKDGINIAAFSATQLQLRGNLVFETTGFIKVSQGNLDFKDGNNTNFMSLDTVLQRVRLIKPLELDESGKIYFTDEVTFSPLSNPSQSIILINQDGVQISDFSTEGNITFDGPSNLHSIVYKSKLFNITDGSNNIYMQFNSESKSVFINYPLYIPTVLQIQAIQFFPDLSIYDANNNRFLYLDSSNQSVHIDKLINLTANGKIQFGNNNITFTDGSTNVIVINRTSIDISTNINFKRPDSLIVFNNSLIVNNGTSDILKVINNSIDTSANIQLLRNDPTITFRTGELKLIDLSTNYVGFNATTKRITTYQIIDVSNNIFFKRADSTITYNNSLNINDGNNNIVKFTTESIDISTNINFKKINPTITYNNLLNISDGTNNILTLTANSIDISTNINFKKINPTITYNNSLSISDGTNNIATITANSIDISTNINFKKINPTITYNNLLNISDGTNNIVTLTSNSIDISTNINFKKINSQIVFNNSLIVNDGDSNIVTLTNESIDTSANIQLIKDNPTIKFRTGELTLADLSNNYIGFNATTKRITTYQIVDFSNNINFRNANTILTYNNSININNGTTNILTLTTDSIDTSANIQLIKDSPIIRFRTGELTVADLSSNYIGFNATTKRITTYQIVDFSNNINFRRADSLITYNNSLNINNGTTNILTLTTNSIDTSANIQLIKDNPIIRFRTGELTVTDLSSNYIGFNATTKRITTYQIVDFSNNINFRNTNSILTYNNSINFNNGTNNILTLTTDSIDTSANIQLIKDSPIIRFRTGELTVNDLSANYVGFNATTKRITTYQIVDFSNNINFRRADSLINYNNSINFNNGTNNILSLTTDSIDTSANIQLIKDSPIIRFRTGELKFVDTSNNNYLGFDKNNKLVKFYQPIDLTTNGNINFGPNLNFNNNGTQYMNIDASNTLIKMYKPLDINTLQFSNSELLIKDSSGNKYLGFDSVNKMIHFYQPTDLSGGGGGGGGGGIGDASGIKFTLDTFTFSDTSNNNYIVLDKTNQKVNITQPLDISGNGNILFNEKINFKSYNQNILSIENTANYPQIEFTEKLTLQNTVTNEMYANPVLRYNIIAENVNSFEKKYLAKTNILGGSGIVQYYFRNVVEHKDEQITFRGKVISRDLSNNSASFTFEGCTNYKNQSNANNLEFELNVLHSPNNDWTIKSFNIYSTDLVMEVQSNQSSTTNWVVSIESISV